MLPIFRNIHLFGVRFNFNPPFSQIVTIDEVVTTVNRILRSTVNTVA